MSKRILNALYEIQKEGLLPINGYALGFCVMLEEKVKEFSLPESKSFRHGLRIWPLFSGNASFPINAQSAELDAYTQYIEVGDSSAPYKNEYLGLRWHLLHHLINYFEDLNHE